MEAVRAECGTSLYGLQQLLQIDGFILLYYSRQIKCNRLRRFHFC